VVIRESNHSLAWRTSSEGISIVCASCAAVLARTLGVDITVAVKWQRAAADDWASYAVDVSRRVLENQ
jgi:hypothetical protein